MKKGTYYLGDLSYMFNELTFDTITKETNYFENSENVIFSCKVFTTIVAPEFIYSNNKNDIRLYCNSGILSIVPVELFEEDNILDITELIGNELNGIYIFNSETDFNPTILKDCLIINNDIKINLISKEEDNE